MPHKGICRLQNLREGPDESAPGLLRVIRVQPASYKPHTLVLHLGATEAWVPPTGAPGKRVSPGITTSPSTSSMAPYSGPHAVWYTVKIPASLLKVSPCLRKFLCDLETRLMVLMSLKTTSAVKVYDIAVHSLVCSWVNKHPLIRRLTLTWPSLARRPTPAPHSPWPSPWKRAVLQPPISDARQGGITVNAS